MKPKPWDRSLWGVVFTTPREPPILIGETWHEQACIQRYAGEPCRVLLFTTRKLAQAWCAEYNARFRSRPKGDTVRLWRVRPVRVRERVEVV